MTASKQVKSGDFLRKVTMLVKFGADKSTDEYKRTIATYEKGIKSVVLREYGDIEIVFRQEEKPIPPNTDFFDGYETRTAKAEDGYQLIITAYAK